MSDKEISIPMTEDVESHIDNIYIIIIKYISKKTDSYVRKT